MKDDVKGEKDCGLAKMWLYISSAKSIGYRW